MCRWFNTYNNEYTWESEEKKETACVIKLHNTTWKVFQKPHQIRLFTHPYPSQEEGRAVKFL
jgi:hypothetical protein